MKAQLLVLIALAQTMACTDSKPVQSGDESGRDSTLTKSANNSTAYPVALDNFFLDCPSASGTFFFKLGKGELQAPLDRSRKGPVYRFSDGTVHYPRTEIHGTITQGVVTFGRSISGEIRYHVNQRSSRLTLKNSSPAGRTFVVAIIDDGAAKASSIGCHLPQETPLEPQA